MQKLNGQLQKTEGGYALTLRRPYRAAYGFGEKFDSVDQKGKLVRACVREKCFYQGEYTYCSMPFLLTPDGFGLYVDTYVEVGFDLRTEGEITLAFEEGSRGEQADVYLFEGTPKQILTQFRTLTGMPRLFPKWVLGAWMSANRWRTQDELEEQRRLTRQYGFPHNVMVVEPWSDLTTHYLWNGSTIPPKAGDECAPLSEITFGEPWKDPKALIDGLHADGLHLLLWVVPMYAQGVNIETAWNVPQCLSDNKYVSEHGECVMAADGTPYTIPHTWCVGSMVPDFTDPVGTKHWFDRFRYLKELGIDGFKTDGGEFIHEHSVRFRDGTTGKEGQNRYCEDYTAAFAGFIGEEGIVFSRAGGQKSPSFTVLWAGDQESTWSEYRSVLKAGLSAGLSGFSAWGFDIAGFSGYLPTAELYLRAVQTAAFCPVMQCTATPFPTADATFRARGRSTTAARGTWRRSTRAKNFWNFAANNSSCTTTCCPISTCSCGRRTKRASRPCGTLRSNSRPTRGPSGSRTSLCSATRCSSLPFWRTTPTAAPSICRTACGTTSSRGNATRAARTRSCFAGSTVPSFCGRGGRSRFI